MTGRGIVKLEAFRSLKAYIASQIPELAQGPGGADRIIVTQTPPEQHVHFPSLAIVPGRFRLESCDEDIHSTPTMAKAVVVVGAWQTTVQLRLAHATEYQRYELEERLTDLFFQTEGRRGILLTEVTACPQLGDILASWDLQDEEWQEEFAFSSQEWAMLTLQGTIPALATRDGVYTIDELRLGITTDFNIPATSAGFDTIPGIVRINEDGTITPL